MTDYYVENATTLVDGDTFCGGSPCTSADTIIIRGGARGSLRFQDFNGSGSYITITNENTNPDSKVEITSNGANSSTKILNLKNCKYVDLRGDNDPDLEYGIKVINDGTPVSNGTVWVYGESDHIKLGYLEVAFDDNTTASGIGIQVQDANLTTAWTFSNFEIHHNYIHDSKYCGMYLGHNQPTIDNNPYVGTFSIHDNLLEDLGSYGITYKGINGPNNYIYNNVVKRTGIIEASSPDDCGKHGIGVQFACGGNYVEIYNNWVEKTKGAGLKIGDDNHLVHDNTICGCGYGYGTEPSDEQWHNGITVFSAYDVEIYDNIIIQPKRYGIYGGYGMGSCSHKRNLIGDPGVGEAGGDGLVEGTGVDANWYEADVADFGFTAWSDDGDYSNDIFTFGGTPYTRSRGILRQKPRYNVPGGRFR